MRLLPDIEMNRFGERNIIYVSMQSPYTIDGKLITDIYLRDNQEVCITSNLGCFIFNIEEFEYRYNMVMRSIERQRINFYDELGHYTVLLNFNEYLDSIITQCCNINRRSYKIRLEERLIRQGRSSEYDSRFSPRMYDGFDDLFTLRPPSDHIFHTGHNVELNSSSSKNKKYIHPHNYKPEYIKHYLSDRDSSLLLGVEIEVAGNEKEPDREDVVKKCIQIMNGNDNDEETLIYSTSDSTVQIELDTMPCTLEFHKQKMNYRELFKYLDGLGYKGHDCANAGLHIHVNRDYLGKTELKQQLVISKILYILEKFNDEICVIARRNSYSCFVGKNEVNKNLAELYNKYSKDKKVALNLKHDDTIEFRCFRSTLKYETFILTLEFVKNIVDYAKLINIENIEQICWNDLMNTFSDELRDYYVLRLEKKEKDNGGVISPSDALSRLSESILRAGTVNRNCRAYSQETMIETPNDFIEIIERISNQYIPEDIGNVSLNNSDEIKQLKKQIRDKKKELCKCKDYRGQVAIRQDLERLQKELKKKKKTLTT